MNRVLKDFKEHNVKHLVRACEKAYDETSIKEQGIEVTELKFPDGKLPEQDIIDKWLEIVDEFNWEGKNEAETIGGLEQGAEKLERKQTIKSLSGNEKKEHPRIGVHCVAGLGRAPFLVAIGLVFLGMSSIEALEMIKKERPGAINWAQADFIMHYKPPKRKKDAQNKNATCECIIF